jgi:hypothetical protein
MTVTVTQAMLKDLPPEYKEGDKVEIFFNIGWEGSQDDGNPVLNDISLNEGHDDLYEIDPDTIHEREQAEIFSTCWELAEQARRDSYERYCDYVYESMKDEF